MRLFLDANVVVAVLNKEYPLFNYASRVMSLVDRRHFQLWMSPVTVAIAFYFSSKKHGEIVAKRKIQTLLEYISVTSMDQHCARQATSNPKIHDLEDGLQYYSALGQQCDRIVTENTSDFYFSEIPVVTCEQLIKEIKGINPPASTN